MHRKGAFFIVYFLNVFKNGLFFKFFVVSRECSLHIRRHIEKEDTESKHGKNCPTKE